MCVKTYLHVTSLQKNNAVAQLVPFPYYCAVCDDEVIAGWLVGYLLGGERDELWNLWVR